MIYVASTADFHGKDFIQSDPILFTTDLSAAESALENDFAHNGKRPNGYSRAYFIEGWELDTGNETESDALRSIWNEADDNGDIEEPDFYKELVFDEQP